MAVESPTTTMEERSSLQSALESMKLQQGSDAQISTHSDFAEMRAHDEAKDRHYNDLKEWLLELRQGVPVVMAKKSRYDRVLVLPLYWEKSDRAHIPEKLKELLAVFDEFNFETKDPFEIPDENCDIALGIKLLEKALKIGNKNRQNLFIIYYGGHGVQNKDGKCFWTPKEKVTKDSSLVECSEFQKYLARAECDILFLFDCCYATAMIDDGHDWKRRCEIFGASDAWSKAGGDAGRSFTAAVAMELRTKTNGISVLQLWSDFTSKQSKEKYKLASMPAYRKLSKGPVLASIALCPPKPQDSSNAANGRYGAPEGVNTATGDNISTSASSVTLQEWKSSTDARILFKLEFLNPVERPVIDEFLLWLEHRPHNIVNIEVAVQREVDCRALFEAPLGCYPSGH